MERSISEYFLRARDMVAAENPSNVTTVQFFQRGEGAVLAGMEEVMELLRERLSGRGVSVGHLPEGSVIGGGEVVLELEGRYQDFGVYEGIIDGILSRATSLATNARRCAEAAGGKEVICMADRSDHYVNHRRDGRAMYVGGMRSFSCAAQLPGPDCRLYGSIPHAVIQNFGGNLPEVMELYGRMFPGEDLVALVDFHNDVVADSLAVLERLGTKLRGVRVDTSGNMRDAMFGEDEEEYGVTPNQIKRLRAALDGAGGGHVGIYVSSGFDPEKIRRFEAEGAPVDGYGVGEYLLGIRNTFSADAVRINGRELAKAGRGYRRNEGLLWCLL